MKLWLYNWDGSGQEGNDVYFNVELNGTTYTFLVRAYLTDASTEVYQAAKALNIGDKIDMEGFLYWYNGANPHITSIKPVRDPRKEGFGFGPLCSERPFFKEGRNYDSDG